MVLSVALGINAYRRGKLRVERAFQTILEREKQRLQTQMESGQWEPLPPDAAMRSVMKEMTRLEGMLASLDTGRYNAALVANGPSSSVSWNNSGRSTSAWTSSDG